MKLFEDKAQLVNNVKYVSSLDIAKHCGKRHKNVLSDIDFKMSNVVIDCGKDAVLESTYIASNGKRNRQLLLNETITKMLLSRYSKHTFEDTKDKIIFNQIERHEIRFGKDIIENLFSNYTILPQHPVLNGKYKIDWYIPELKLAIEYDEEHHKHQLQEDASRQQEIENHLGCKFIRYKKP